MTEVEQPPPQNGIDLSANEDDDHNKSRPADIEQDMREMERRKRVEAIMGSKLFREELERIVDSARDGGGTSGILQQLSDIVGLPTSRIGSVYKASNCLMPINDIRGVESMGYAKGEKILRCKLAATFRLLDLYGWTQGLGAQITARLKVDQEYFLVNPYGLLYHEITASSLNKVDMQGNIVEQGTTNFGVNKSHFVLHSVVHAARPDIRCAIYIGCSPVVAVSSLKAGLLPITRDACVLGEITTHAYTGILDNDERDRLIRNLGPNSKVMLLTNHGAICCGETIEEAFYAACHIVQACETQLKLLPVGLENLSLIPEESRKIIYEQSRRPPEDLEKKFAAAVNTSINDTQDEHNTSEAAVPKIGQAPKWRVGGAEFEALMRMLDNAGYRTGYIYRHPLIKSDPPKPKNDVELPPAVSSLGYLLEEEELFRQGIWKKGDLRKGGDRSRWLNSPNVYQKVEVLETGTPDPKKITKWVAEGSPSHSTPVRIEDPLQFVPAGTNPKEFKRLQQQIKDNRRADKISAGPQSHILEGVTWDEAARIRDATVSATGDHVVLMGAASKGIIQRGFQHNATVYKAPYAKNPFDNVTDDELNEYKRTVERKKKSIHGEYTDTDFSESEALSSLPPGQQGKHGKHAGAQSEPEDMGAHQVMRIETQQAPVPSQPEVVLSDATLSFINGERSHTAVNRKPPTGRALNVLRIITPNFADHKQFDRMRDENLCKKIGEEIIKEVYQVDKATQADDDTAGLLEQHRKLLRELIQEMKTVTLFKKQKEICGTQSSEEELEIEEEEEVENSIIENINNDSKYNNETQEATNMILTFTNNFNHEQNFINNKNWQTSTLFMPTTPTNTKLRYTRKIELNPKQFYNFKATTNTQPHPPPPPFYNTISSNYAASSIAENSANSLSMNICSNYFENQIDTNEHSRQIEEIENLTTQTNWQLINTHAGIRRRRDSFLRRKNWGPYRTVSHFGFNFPKNPKQPEHKHLPAIHKLKYKPLKKSNSYEEIFSSRRFIDLCDNCFEKVTRIKPEYLLPNIHQRNLIEEKLDTENNTPIYDYAYVVEPMETLIEIDENKLTPKNNNCCDYCDSETSFIDKIMRLNYSEESSNSSFLPHPITSNISLSIVDGIDNNNRTFPPSAKNSTLNIENELTNKMSALRITNNEETTEIERLQNDFGQFRITEVLEFGNWLKGGSETSEASEAVYETINSQPAENLIKTITNFLENTAEATNGNQLENVNDFLDTEIIVNGVAHEKQLPVSTSQVVDSMMKHKTAVGKADQYVEQDIEESFETAKNACSHNSTIDFNKFKQNYVKQTDSIEKGTNETTYETCCSKEDVEVFVTFNDDHKSHVMSQIEDSTVEQINTLQLEQQQKDVLNSTTSNYNNVETLNTTLKVFENCAADFYNTQKFVVINSTENELNTEEFEFETPKVVENATEVMKNATEVVENATEVELKAPEVNLNVEGVELKSKIDLNTPEVNENTPEVTLTTPEVDENITEIELKAPEVDLNVQGVELKSKIYINAPELNENTTEVALTTPEVIKNSPEVALTTPEVNENTTEVKLKATDVVKNTLEAKSKAQLDLNAIDIEIKAPEIDLAESKIEIISSGSTENAIKSNTSNKHHIHETLNNNNAKKSKTTWYVEQNDMNLMTSKIVNTNYYIEQEEEYSNPAEIIIQEAFETADYVDQDHFDDDLAIDDEELMETQYVECEVEELNSNEMKNSKEFEEEVKILNEELVVEVVDTQITKPVSTNDNISLSKIKTTLAPTEINFKHAATQPKMNDIEKTKSIIEKIDPFQVSKNVPPLMTRDERLRRKTEFQELWEDHVAFFKAKENHNASDNDDIKELKNLTIAGGEENAEYLEKEVFYGESSIVFISSPNQTAEDIEHCSSDSMPFNQNLTKKSSSKTITKYSNGNATFEMKKALDLENDMKRFNRFQKRYERRQTFNNNNNNNSNTTSSEDDMEMHKNTNVDENELNEYERLVLKKIRDNKLKQRKDAEIFEKIENGILNKLTPKRLEELVQKQRLQQTSSDEATASNKSIYFNETKTELSTDSTIDSKNKIKRKTSATSMTTKQQTHTNTNQEEAIQKSKTRRSRSRLMRRNLTANFNLTEFTSPPPKISRTTTPPPVPPKKLLNKKSPDECWPHSTTTQLQNTTEKNNKSYKRNFIHENIQNASKTRLRLSPTSPRTPILTSSSNSSPRNLETVPELEIFNSVSSTGIYPFQSKIVHGSPCLWVTLPTCTKTNLNFNKQSTKRTTKSLKKRFNKFENHEDVEKQQHFDELPGCSKNVPLTTENLQKFTKVDAEINALSNQMQAIDPTLQNIKRKCNDFGENLQKCTRTLNECVTLQQEVKEEQQKLHEEINLNHYAEQIMCKTQTYSISETED